MNVYVDVDVSTCQTSSSPFDIEIDFEYEIGAGATQLKLTNIHLVDLPQADQIDQRICILVEGALPSNTRGATKRCLPICHIFTAPKDGTGAVSDGQYIQICQRARGQKHIRLSLFCLKSDKSVLPKRISFQLTFC